MISCNRNQFVANKLGKLNKETILDIGCRDKILKKYLKGNFKYLGIDFDLNNKKTDFINFNLENGLPKNLKNIDYIVALDVFEHVENIHELLSHCLKLAKRKLIIALPNMSYYKFRINFLLTGEISGKYTFHPQKTIDRHRWLTTYFNNIYFIKKNCQKNYKIHMYNFIAERKRNFILFYLEKFLSIIFPKLFVYENIFFIEKINK